MMDPSHASCGPKRGTRAPAVAGNRSPDLPFVPMGVVTAPREAARASRPSRIDTSGRSPLLALIALFLVVSIAPPLRPAQAADPVASLPPNVRAHVSEALLAQLERTSADEFVPVILSLDPPIDLVELEREIEARGPMTRWQRHRFVVERAQELAARTQRALLAALEAESLLGSVEAIHPFWVTNAVAFRARPAALARLLEKDAGIGSAGADSKREGAQTGEPAPDPGRQRAQAGEPAPDPGRQGAQGGDPAPDPGAPGGRHTLSILQVHEDSPVQLKGSVREVGFASPAAGDSVGSNLVAIRAPEVWSRGLTGAGRLVGHFDAGADGSHVSLAARWRGARPDVPWDHAWFDPYTASVFPYGTDGGHGTGTLSVMVGTRPDGPPLGVAYEAEWIAAGVVIQYNVSSILAAFQWVADPDGDPSTIDDVPDVVNHSWGTRDECGTAYWDAIDLVEAAGTVNVIAVANAGPAPGSVQSPESRASSPYENFGVGGVDTNQAGYPVRTTSARGPSPCDGVSIKPELVGPGTRVQGAGPNDNVDVAWSGTSFAAPHVSGVVALLRQLDPSLTVREIKRILMVTAQDLAAPGEDNDTGWGLVDAAAAVEYVERNITTYPPPFAAIGPVDPAPVALLRWAPPHYLGRGEVPDLIGYRIYRTPLGVPFEAEPFVEVPAFPTEFWDRSAVGSQRYMVSALYPGGRESEPTAPVDVEIERVEPGPAEGPPPPHGSSPSDPDLPGTPGSPDILNPTDRDFWAAASEAGKLGLRVLPNPFRAGTDLHFWVPTAGPIRLEVWDAAGRRVRRLREETVPNGPHQLSWSGTDDEGNRLPAGLYFVRLSQAGEDGFTVRVARLN